MFNKLKKADHKIKPTEKNNQILFPTIIIKYL